MSIHSNCHRLLYQSLKVAIIEVRTNMILPYAQSSFTKYCHKIQKRNLSGSFQSLVIFQMIFLQLQTYSFLQSFFSRLAFAIFSWRFCFFFCSFSLASIILANFQDSTALARNNGVRAKITVVRKPYGSFAAHSTTYSAQAFISNIFAEVLEKRGCGGKNKRKDYVVKQILKSIHDTIN